MNRRPRRHWIGRQRREVGIQNQRVKARASQEQTAEGKLDACWFFDPRSTVPMRNRAMHRAIPHGDSGSWIEKPTRIKFSLGGLLLGRTRFDALVLDAHFTTLTTDPMTPWPPIHS